MAARAGLGGRNALLRRLSESRNLSDRIGCERHHKTPGDAIFITAMAFDPTPLQLNAHMLARLAPSGRVETPCRNEPATKGRLASLPLLAPGGRPSGHAIEIDESGGLALVLLERGANLADEPAAPALRRLFVSQSAIEDAENVLDRLAHEPALQEALVSRLTAEILALDQPLRASSGRSLLEFRQLVGAALTRWSAPVTGIERYLIDGALHFSIVADRAGPRQDASLALGNLSSQGFQDVFSPLQMTLRALLRHFDPRGSVLAADHNGCFYAALSPLRIDVALERSAHARLMAGARVAAFWRAHPELGSLDALAAPDRHLLTLPEILISLLDETPRTALAFLPAAGDFGYDDGVSHIAWILDHLAIAGFADCVDTPGPRARSYLAPENVAELRWVRGKRWPDAIHRLLGGTIFT